MPDYAEIYYTNRYSIRLSSTETFSFSLETFTDHPFFSRRFAIITAHNPHNRQLPHQENVRRNESLYSELNSDLTLDAIGCGVDGHCEAGYLLFDLSREEAIALGVRYEQFAIFYCDTKALMYIACESREVIVSVVR